MRRALPLLLLAAFILAGCGKGSASRPPAVPRAALNAGGEPQWSAQVRGERLIFTDGAAIALNAKASRTDHGAAGVVWVAAAAPASRTPAIVLTTTRKACRDADTGMAYPLTAVAETGGRRYLGCAAPPGQGLGPRQ